MLDDASEKGLEEALKLLPVSSAGSGLLVTSQLIKSEAELRRFLTSRADGAAADVSVCECGVLDQAKALELFHVSGFKFDPEDFAIQSDIKSELMVSRSCFSHTTCESRTIFSPLLCRVWAIILLQCGCSQSGATVA